MLHTWGGIHSVRRLKPIMAFHSRRGENEGKFLYLSSTSVCGYRVDQSSALTALCDLPTRNETSQGTLLVPREQAEMPLVDSWRSLQNLKAQKCRVFCAFARSRPSLIEVRYHKMRIVRIQRQQEASTLEPVDPDMPLHVAVRLADHITRVIEDRK